MELVESSGRVGDTDINLVKGTPGIRCSLYYSSSEIDIHYTRDIPIHSGRYTQQLSIFDKHIHRGIEYIY